ncbi:3'-5' exoribonuclease domain-containing protein [Rhizobium arsenicireducens]
MEPQYQDVMIDTETTGTNPETNGMIQLSAVKFDLKTRTVQPFPSMFDRCMNVAPGRVFDASTAQWWQKRRSVYDAIMARAEDPAVVMGDFVKWVGLNNPKPVRFWAKPVTFDWGFVASHLRQFDLPQPFHYRWAMDMNSYFRGLAGDVDLESHYTEAVGGDAHNALFDCLQQIDQIFSAEDKYGRR